MSSLKKNHCCVFSDDERMVLEYLSDKKYHSGVQLGSALNKSRTTIMNYMKKLSDSGLLINKVIGRGYQLQIVPEFYDRRILLKRPNLSFFDTVDSTNQFLLEQSDVSEGTVVLTDFQSHGRGRRGRDFLSSYGTQIMFSYATNFKEIGEINGLSIVIGIAVVKALESVGINNVQIKWPNDLYINGQKVGGILVETSCSKKGVYTVIGVGINVVRDFLFLVDLSKLDREIGAIDISKHGISRSEMVLLLCEYIDKYIANFKRVGLQPYIETYNNYDAFAGSNVRIITNERIIEGVNGGINATGAIILYTPEGKLVEVVAGDVSLRKADIT